MSADQQAQGAGGGDQTFARGGGNHTDLLGANFDQKGSTRAINLATSENLGGARGESVRSGVASISAMSRKNRASRRSVSAPAPAPADPAPEFAPPAFREDAVAARFGLPREKIAAIRAAHLAEGRHFATAGNAVVLTPEGVDAIGRALEAEASTQRAKVSLVEGETAPAPASPADCTGGVLAPLPDALRPERISVQVVRTFANRRLILARRTRPASQTEPFLVRVRDNTLFHPSLPPFDVIRAGDGTFQYTGRLPRRLGRW